MRQSGAAASRYDAAFIAALNGGGDSRLALDTASRTTKYLCPQRPDETLTCFSSCTASPVSEAGFQDAQACYRQIMVGPDGSLSAGRLAACVAAVERRLLDLAGGGAAGGVILLPSGTDAILFAALLLALDSPGRTLTPILPSAPETGSGVPRAAACRQFDGATADIVLREGWGEPILVALRQADGLPRRDGDIDQGFAEAARNAPGRPVVFLTHGTKTGLMAPLTVPPGADVVVDACQFRLSPASLQTYLRRGWPTVITGSKFLAGPAFCGALLLPRGRFETIRQKALALWARRMVNTSEAGHMATLGPLLRWVAALSAVRQPSPWEQVPAQMRRLQSEAEAVVADLPGVRIVPGPSEAMVAAGGITPGIITFALRHCGHDLSTDELRTVHRGLAACGVLVGQPVSLGAFGGLRLAISMRDLAHGTLNARLEHVRASLPRAIAAAQG